MANATTLTNRHAYLIIAHNEFEILKKQITLIDDERNDIYIHVDKKVKDFDFSYYRGLVKHSNLYFTKRVCVYWGDYSMVQAELYLFEAASKKCYSYYHLISGVDLPITSQDRIHAELDNGNGLEYIHFGTKQDAKERLKYVTYLYIHKPETTLLGLCFYIWEKIRHKLHLRQISTQWDRDKELCFGSQWCSITDDFVKYILQNKKWIRKYFLFSHVPDELFIQTLAYNSKFKERLSDKSFSDNHYAARRYIDWNRGNPYVFRSEDFDSIKNSNCFFARKFSNRVDEKIIQQIYCYVLEQE